MFTIRKQHIAQFKALASSIKTDDRMPILQYVLVTVSANEYTLLKNGLGSYLQQTHEHNNTETGQFLIKESALYEFSEDAPTDVIEITAGETQLLLKCINWERETPTEPVAHYPAAQPAESGGIELNDEVLKQIGIASGYVTDEEIPTPRSHVFIGKGYIAAGDSSIVYLSPNGNIDSLVFRKNVAEVIGGLKACQYIRTGNYDIFKTLNANLAFIKPEMQWFDLTSLAAGDLPTEFVIDKSDLVRFCNAAIKATPSKLVLATMETKGKGVLLQMTDAAVSERVKNMIPAQGGPAELFKFNVANMLRLLKGVPDEQLNFAPGKKRYYVNGAGYNAMIMALGV